MGLKEDLFSGVVTAMNALGNIPKDIVYTSVVLGAYNAATDAQARTETNINCKAVVYKGKVENQDYKKTELNQTKVLIAGQVFLTAGVEPIESDFMTIDGDKYEIKLINPAPTGAAFVFTVRKI